MAAKRSRVRRRRAKPGSSRARRGGSLVNVHAPSLLLIEDDTDEVALFTLTAIFARKSILTRGAIESAFTLSAHSAISARGVDEDGTRLHVARPQDENGALLAGNLEYRHDDRVVRRRAKYTKPHESRWCDDTH